MRAAAAGDGGAARAVVEAVQDPVYGWRCACSATRRTPRTRPAHVFEFADIVAAHRLIESGEARGKIVVRGPED